MELLARSLNANFGRVEKSFKSADQDKLLGRRPLQRGVARGGTTQERKCLGRTIPDTFDARSADSTGLKMRQITRGESFDDLVGAGEQHGRNFKSDCLRCA